MMTWKDVINYANNGNLTPPKRVEKAPEEWKALLTDEEYYVTRLKGTEEFMPVNVVEPYSLMPKKSLKVELVGHHLLSPLKTITLLT